MNPFLGDQTEESLAHVRAKEDPASERNQVVTRSARLTHSNTWSTDPSVNDTFSKLGTFLILYATTMFLGPGLPKNVNVLSKHDRMRSHSGTSISARLVQYTKIKIRNVSQKSHDEPSKDTREPVTIKFQTRLKAIQHRYIYIARVSCRQLGNLRDPPPRWFRFDPSRWWSPPSWPYSRISK